MDKKDRKILKLLEQDVGMVHKDIAIITELTEDEVKERIRALEECGIIRGYKCVVDTERLDDSAVSAIIQLKVTPKAELGFDDVARRIAEYPEVEAVALLSGSCDLSVTVRGRSFQHLSSFVARELATIESVTSTSTQFIMKRYKEHGISFTDAEADERCVMSL